MHQSLQTIAGLPGLPELPPGWPPLGGIPPGLPNPGVPPGLAALLAGLPGAPPGLPPQNIDWIAQLAAIQAAQPPQAPAPGLQLTAPPPGTGGISPPSLAAWGLGGAFTAPAHGAPGVALPPGLATVPTLPQAWGQPNDALAALLGRAVEQAASDGSALGLTTSSAPPGIAGAEHAVLSQIPQLPQMAPPQMQGLPPGMPPPAPPPSAHPPPATTPSAGQLENARREEERILRMRRESKEQADRQAERREKMDQVEKKKCHLHKKLKDSCKFCKKYKELLNELENSQKSSKEEERPADNKRKRKLDRAISEERDGGQAEVVAIAIQKNFGLTGLLQTHVVECAHFKSLLTLETFEQLVDETYQFANDVAPYMSNSGTLPTALFCCVYRFFTMGLDSRQLRRLLDSQESPYLRCAGFLYVRYGMAADQLWDLIGDYILDDEVFKPSADSSETQTTIGEYVEGLLAQDKYYNTVFPRLPGSTRRKLEERLAPVGQYRKRTKANKEILDVYRDPGTKIEA